MALDIATFKASISTNLKAAINYAAPDSNVAFRDAIQSSINTAVDYNTAGSDGYRNVVREALKANFAVLKPTGMTTEQEVQWETALNTNMEKFANSVVDGIKDVTAGLSLPVANAICDGLMLSTTGFIDKLSDIVGDALMVWIAGGQVTVATGIAVATTGTAAAQTGTTTGLGTGVIS